jgi:hypothetical protein
LIHGWLPISSSSGFFFSTVLSVAYKAIVFFGASFKDAGELGLFPGRHALYGIYCHEVCISFQGKR